MTASALIGWAAQTGLMVSILIGFILIIRRPFARIFGAKAAYALWVLPAIRLFMPSIERPALGSAIPDTISGFTEIMILPAMDRVAPVSATPTIDWVFVCAIIWLGVAGVWFGFQLLRQAVFLHRLDQDTHLVGPMTDIHTIGQDVGQLLKLKRLPELRLGHTEAGPMVTGLLRARIILPADFSVRFSPTQQHYALIHEMAHIKRRDLWAALAVLAFRALNWPNPLVHFAAHKFRLDQEAACDAAVVRALGGGADAAHSYGQTLVQAAKLSAQRTGPQPLGLALMNKTDGDMS